ncbi:MAG: hypothetical protein LBT85_01920 [Bifidobacteriaceae bacterium]|jgi:hypothetical protein|nr:hypothetical protein [Bifidobacteriaceae bacterium]
MFDPVPFSENYQILGLAFLGTAILAFLLIILILKFNIRKLAKKMANQYFDVARKMRMHQIYIRRLNRLTKRYKDGLLSDDELFTKLSLILREYAVKRTHMNIENNLLDSKWNKLTLRDIDKFQFKNDNWRIFQNIFVKLYGSQFGFSREQFTPDIALTSARKLVNSWR